MALSALARASCSANEVVGLSKVLGSCLADHSLSRSPSTVDYRRTVALSQLGASLSDRQANGPPTALPAAALDWLGLQRDERAHHAAQRCLAHGRGRWSALPAAAGEPYLLSTDLLPGFNTSRWWWGACDDDLHHGVVRPPRAAVMQAWHPEGDGCDALRKGRRHVPSLRTLAASFCQRHAGRTVLFVGDSVQRQLASSFAMAVGVYASRPQLPARITADTRTSSAAAAPQCLKDRRYLASLARMHEFNLHMSACGTGSRAVHVRFIRNEAVRLDGRARSTASAGLNTSGTDESARGGQGRHGMVRGTPMESLPAPSAPQTPPAPPLPRPYLMCEWADAAAHADFVVLNRGMHYVPDALVAQQLHETFRTLRNLRERSHDDRELSFRSSPLSASAPAQSQGVNATTTASRTAGAPVMAPGSQTGAVTQAANDASAAQGGKEGASLPAWPRHPIADVVYRSTHASLPSCHLLDDPLPTPFPYSALDSVTRNYHWADFERQNNVSREVAAAHRVAFLNVHPATAVRPGGHMPSRRGAKGDCAHYCLPGPIDEWVRSLLALWT